MWPHPVFFLRRLLTLSCDVLLAPALLPTLHWLRASCLCGPFANLTPHHRPTPFCSGQLPEGFPPSESCLFPYSGTLLSPRASSGSALREALMSDEGEFFEVKKSPCCWKIFNISATQTHSKLSYT